jgi:transcription termination factor Rho
MKHAETHAEVVGTLELDNKRGGHLREQAKNYAPRQNDPQVPRAMIERLGLRGGELLAASIGGGGRGPQRVVGAIRAINAAPAEENVERPPFGELTVIDPHEPIRMATPGGPTSMRVVDLMTPIGKGQRALIVSPPRSGKTVLLKQMASAIRANHPEVLLMMLLVDERPEEVTEMRRALCAEQSGWHIEAPEVVYSNNDQDVPSHLRISRLMIEKAKRCVEQGRDVVILLDSLTRLSRAFNASVGSSGRTMTGGIDIRALTEPKAMFGAARKIEHGGSLTIIASVLIETGSRMDDFIFQEFKGTGNMELVLSRDLANLRLWPAVDLSQSGTRKEEHLLGESAVTKISRLRRRLMSMPPAGQIRVLVEELEKHPTNEAMLAAMAD